MKDVEPGSRRRRIAVVMLVASVLVVAAAVASVLAARSVVHRDQERAQKDAALSSVEVASVLRLAIQREQDLAVSATGFFLGNPTASNAEFVAWSQDVQAMDRYPELLGWGKVVSVTPDELEAYAAAVAVDPPGVVTGPFVLTPPGDRPYYCLFSVGESRTPGSGAPAGFDYCAGTEGEPIVAARDSGRSSYQAVDTGNAVTLAVQVPFYRGGRSLATVASRREAFVGWVGLGFDPQVVLEGALRDHPDAAVTLRFNDSSSDVQFSSRGVPSDADAVTTDLGNGWTVQTFVTVPQRGVFSDTGASTVLFAGIVSSLLLGTVVLVLGTGRARALQLVGERTGELRHQALHDALTGLPNRALIMDRIEQMLARNRRHLETGAALYIDLDDFKNVNDTLGHEAGDRLLVAVAARLTSTLRGADTIGRMGGDEFVVLIDGASLEVDPELVAQRLLNVMHQPFELEGASTPLSVNISVGVAVGDRSSGGDLLRDADVALYQAKTDGKNRYEVFSPDMQTAISRRIDLDYELRSALDDGQFRLAYQPIYCLDDLHLVAVEALLRWDNPKRGLIEADEFIPILERTGRIEEVGRWVLRRACSQMAEWHSHGDTLDISVNVSGRQLDHDGIVEEIRDALETSGLDPASLIVEVTETSLMRNTADTARRLQAIKNLGVKIAIDDFGTGYSSLAYLQQFPVDCLKIDRAFTHAITSSPESKALIRTLVQLGRDLHLTTLAEGVETAAEMDQLRVEQVDEVQGFLLSRPLDGATLESRFLLPLRLAAASTPTVGQPATPRPIPPSNR